MNPDATKVLRDEHVLILKVAGVLERVLEARSDASALDLDALEDCVRFFRLFTDACHHGKEEGHLFPELEALGMSPQVGPIAVMLEEHRQGRALVTALAEGLESARGDGRSAELRLLDAAFRYIDLIRGHILKEDNVLFDMADRMVAAGACRRLCQDYDAVCSSSFDGCTKAQLEALATSLGERYPAEAGAD